MSKMNSERPLLKQFPDLSRVLAPGDLTAKLPTPVQQLAEIDTRLWVKRDDLTGAGYGGNKIRKLEFVLPHAQRRGANRIITLGGLGTHHGLATAICCAQLGLACDILLFDQPLTAHVRENLLLMNHYGARLYYHGSLARTLAAYALHPRRLDRRSYFLFAGASNPIGSSAYVNAAFELDQQIRAQAMPAPAAIYCAVGSMGTLAGLTLGLALCGRDIPVLGVRVIDSHVGPFAACTPAAASQLMRKTLAWLRAAASHIENLELPVPQLLDGYFGDGYGTPTPAGEQATQRAQSAGLTLDPTYTAKAFAAALDSLNQTEGPILYWHTLTSADLSQPLQETRTADLPEELQRRLASG